MAADEAELAAGARELIDEKFGGDPGELTIAALPGGASRQAFSIDSGDGRRWMVRRDPPGAGESFNPLAVEFGVLSAAEAAGVPVPIPFAYEPDGGRLGSAGLLMSFVEGTSVGPRVLRRDELDGARSVLPTQLAQALAAIHSIDGAAIEGVPSPGGDPALAACEVWEQQLDEIGEPLPAVEAGLRWLRLHPPRAAAECLVHGDFRLGNLIVDELGLGAVIDWELCHSGDPAEDIGWLCIRSWRFGNDGLTVAGLGELEPFLDAYEAAGGTRPDHERLTWWGAMGNVKWAVICARQAADHLSGVRPSAELASLGRRICEPEWDLLEQLPIDSSASRPRSTGFDEGWG
ncbi:phosphotransferase family protein [soil metagenome]